MIYKKSIKHISITLIALLMVINLSVGCSKSINDDGNDDPGDNTVNIPVIDVELPDTIFLTELVQFPQLPGDKTNIKNVILADSKVYFTAINPRDEHTMFELPCIFTMDVNGTNLQELVNYTPWSSSPDDALSYVSIDGVYVDSSGYLWIAESVVIIDDNQADYINIIRKVDKTGKEIVSFDLSDLATGNDLFNVSAFIVDDAGIIYIASGLEIYVLDNQGRLHFNLENPDFSTQFISLSDGTAALVTWRERNQYLQKFDIERRSWGDIISLPPVAHGNQNVFSGSGEHLYLFNDNTYLNGVIAETGEIIKILNWNNSAVSAEDVRSIMFLTDEYIAVIKQLQTGTFGAEPIIELILLNAASYEDLPERKLLTYGTLMYDSERKYAVEEFNRSSLTHRIHVIDYSLFNTEDDTSAGLLRLTTEMISGNSPDVLDMWGMPLHNFISKGFLTDLYPFLDADLELNRSSFIESVLKASETDGSLYRVIPSFYLGSIIGSPHILGNYPGWNMDEFVAVFKANPQADMPFGPWFDSLGFLSVAFMFGFDEFVNRTTGTVNFESDEFIKLLELVKSLPPKVDLGDTVAIHELIAEGRVIMQMGQFGRLNQLQLNRSMFGGEIVFKGYPVINRNGNAFSSFTGLAISTNCTDKSAAWEFVRIFLTEEYQRDFIPWSFPVNKAIFEEQLKKAMEPLGLWFELVDANGEIAATEVKGFSQEEVDMIRNTINSTTRMINHDDALWDIISETASDYFNGRHTAGEAARIIQNRTAIYISEQAG